MPTALRLPKVLYVADSYQSHAIAAEAYQQALASLGALAARAEEAEVVVFHGEMRRLASLRKRLPSLARKYAVGMLVWESDRLRQDDERAVRQLDEVWTPSLYSAKALVCAHRRVYLLPHVIEDPVKPSASDEARVDAWLQSEAPSFDVLAIMPTHDPRKNAEALVRAVRNLREQVPSLRLVLKTPGGHCDDQPKLVRSTHTLTIHGRISRPCLEVLLRRAKLVVSAHRAEAWGLTLSDALRRRVPLVASAYSGNLSFMPLDGAFGVACDERRVGSHVAHVPFASDAIWGEPCPLSLEAQLLRACQEVSANSTRERTERGFRATRRYSATHLRLLLRARLRDLAHRLSTASPQKGV